MDKSGLEKMKKTSILEQKNILSDKVHLFAYLAVYKCVLSACYEFVLVPLYGYRGYFVEWNALDTLLSWGLLMLLVALAPYDKKRPSFYLYLVSVLLFYLPVNTYAPMTSHNMTYCILVTICLVLVGVIVMLKSGQLTIRVRNPRFIFDIFLVAAILVTVYVLIKTGGVRISLFDLFNSEAVYDVRSESLGLSGVESYIFAWVGDAILPFLTVYYFMKKSYFKVAAAVFLMVVQFMITSLKSYVFFLGFILLACIAMRSKAGFVKMFIGALCAMQFISFLLYEVFDVNLVGLTLDRLIFEGAKNQHWYYDFFQSADFLYWSNGFIGKILGFPYAYSVPIEQVVSYHMSGVGYGANSNMFSDAYAQLGLWGMLLYSAVYALILLLVDATSARLPVSVPVMVFMPMASILLDNSLLTTILTCGLFWIPLMLAIWNGGSSLQDADYAQKVQGVPTGNERQMHAHGHTAYAPEVR
ncbi:hypothetical protein [Gordonibacter massiliensis (ex Traore et al. 2017)]|uniref:Oligosaccharide repeat unit polymerase n=1 Tax=Gordonibacter massiliensis (ex Traore et al. 2017) TaxID=1841863 RepID=A0A842JD69_9ACTN|nr:hypothetical protein [Gordonibacter massiliensis (ex Traore et al. 2017)]MBC2889903.1 hypothetical protein [Gordonibacter massiliensis (ex Traore et al. 2017)]